VRDLASKRLIVAKGIVFLGLAVVAGGWLLLESPSLRAAVLLCILVWSSCRFYHYVDPGLRYAGLTAMLGQIRRSRAARIDDKG
jgi:hypothetical protein